MTTTPTRRLTAALFAAGLLAAIFTAAMPGIARAQAEASVDGLYPALGAQEGVKALARDLTRRLAVDARTAPFFKDLDLSRFEAQMVLHLCEISGGGCRYKGKDMKTVHSGVDITKADFNAVVEVLQQSMDAQRIPFTVQNRLLARLAPMHRDIVNAPAGATPFVPLAKAP